MNDADSKKLEEIDAKIDECGANRKDQHWLISKVKEQDRKIDRLLSYGDGNDGDAEIGDLEDDNRRLQERVRELAEIALDWIGSAQQARGSIFGPRDKVDYESDKQRVYALQHKERK